jgi:hypothetical protein
MIPVLGTQVRRTFMPAIQDPKLMPDQNRFDHVAETAGLSQADQVLQKNEEIAHPKILNKTPTLKFRVEFGNSLLANHSGRTSDRTLTSVPAATAGTLSALTNQQPS